MNVVIVRMPCKSCYVICVLQYCKFKDSERGKQKREILERVEYLEEFEKGSNIILVGNMNAKLHNERIDKVVGKWGEHGKNENGNSIVDVLYVLKEDYF